MNLETYEIEDKVEQNHWWFHGRRKLFQSLIKRMKLSKSANILDVGSSAGTNLRMLKQEGFNNYKGLDISPESQRYCQLKEIGVVILGDIQADETGDCEYDLILATDVLEHLEKDNAALINIHKGLKKGGYLLITVPCFPILWGPQDIVSQHQRRYKKKALLKDLENCGFTLEKNFYFNFFLFAPILIIRKILIWRNKIVNENTINNGMTNQIMKLIFRIDCWLAERISFPFGVSLAIVAQKK